MVLSAFFFSSRRRHTRCSRDWSSDVCSSDLEEIDIHEHWLDYAKLSEEDAWLLAARKIGELQARRKYDWMDIDDKEIRHQAYVLLAKEAHIKITPQVKERVHKIMAA